MCGCTGNNTAGAGGATLAGGFWPNSVDTASNQRVTAPGGPSLAELSFNSQTGLLVAIAMIFTLILVRRKWL